MSDPVVTITDGVPTSGTGTITTLGQTLVDGANATIGAIADAAITAGASGSVSAKLRAISRDVANTAVTNAGTFAVQNTVATPVGTNIIGKVGIDQTNPGTTNGVQLTAGTNVIGHVIVDTAPTTAVTIATAPVLVAGSAVIGKVGIDQTTPGTTNGVQLTAGTALAGVVKVGDGTNTAAVKAASTAPAATDTAMVVTISPNGVNANGQATMANSAPVVIASNQASFPVAATLSAETTKVIGTVNNTPLTNFGAGEYETVAASQTAQVLGATGATGDFISGILVIPATTSPGVVTLLDGATSIPVFVGGASSLATLHPFLIPLGMISVSGAWKLTTGANVSCIGIGNFT